MDVRLFLQIPEAVGLDQIPETGPRVTHHVKAVIIAPGSEQMPDIEFIAGLHQKPEGLFMVRDIETENSTILHDGRQNIKGLLGFPDGEMFEGLACENFIDMDAQDFINSRQFRRVLPTTR